MLRIQLKKPELVGLLSKITVILTTSEKTTYTAVTNVTPQAVYDLVDHLITTKYGRRHPNVIIGGKPRIDLPYTCRDFAKVLLDENADDFEAAMNGATWTDAKGTVHKLPHPTYLEKYTRSLKHVNTQQLLRGILFV